MTTNYLTDNNVTLLLNRARLARDNAERADNRVDHSFYYAIVRALEELKERRAAPAVQAEQTKRLIGWRTTDYTEETSDPEMAKNWAAAVGVLPIFEGDINTRLQAEQLSGNTEPVASLTR